MEYKAGKIDEEKLYQTVQSYLGYLSHANSYSLQNTLKNILWKVPSTLKRRLANMLCYVSFSFHSQALLPTP